MIIGEKVLVIFDNFVPNNVGSFSLLFVYGEEPKFVEPFQKLFDIFSLLVLPPFVHYQEWLHVQVQARCIFFYQITELAFKRMMMSGQT